MTPEDEQLITKQQLCTELKVSKRTVEEMMRLRKIPFIKPSSRLVRFHLPSVIQALRKFEVAAQ